MYKFSTRKTKPKILSIFFNLFALQLWDIRTHFAKWRLTHIAPQKTGRSLSLRTYVQYTFLFLRWKHTTSFLRSSNLIEKLPFTEIPKILWFLIVQTIVQLSRQYSYFPAALSFFRSLASLFQLFPFQEFQRNANKRFLLHLNSSSLISISNFATGSLPLIPIRVLITGSVCHPSIFLLVNKFGTYNNSPSSLLYPQISMDYSLSLFGPAIILYCVSVQPKNKMVEVEKVYKPVNKMIHESQEILAPPSHSDLSNDIFASLQVSSRGSNPWYLSSTASSLPHVNSGGIFSRRGKESWTTLSEESSSNAGNSVSQV